MNIYVVFSNCDFVDMDSEFNGVYGSFDSAKKRLLEIVGIFNEQNGVDNNDAFENFEEANALIENSEEDSYWFGDTVGIQRVAIIP